MKKLIAIISGASLAALVGGVSVANEDNNDQQPQRFAFQAEDHNSSRSNVSSEIEKDGDQTLEGEEVQAEDVNSSRSNVATKVEQDDGGEAIEDNETAKMKGDFSRGNIPPSKATESEAGQDENTPAPRIQQKNFNSSKSNTSTEVATDGDEGNEGDDDGDEVQSPDLTHVRTVKEGDTLPEADLKEEAEEKDDDGDS